MTHQRLLYKITYLQCFVAIACFAPIFTISYPYNCYTVDCQMQEQTKRAKRACAYQCAGREPKFQLAAKSLFKVGYFMCLNCSLLIYKSTKMESGVNGILSAHVVLSTEPGV